ncbi:heparan-alpha-glucosaminide N-acetyltransferase domain-containing protein [Ichthyenterobacterium sp. W332]|uniref:Heparan-alpha-glucosaminide N-acetyltransferase domain-containing protein n=1 Tax=Microcosmobacter mediterraneus TaxID=3075607 RepID=A0ABU2YGJ0_9FLAO|nr:heparan-alpha-glucosaminide N-acetyltransferase domain-containing protein [Ichthyenterobacterium sp. W332]MDT0557283.1 heparan-alpha-glucosaminide N-acetyltransferase domain-containing protein [Ichthyenterobacterium sp. W332]
MDQVKSTRIESIDILRGLVMVIMALDHVRDYTNTGYMFIDPTNLDNTTPGLFLTRWITHFCAPVFVFLAGTSAFLYGRKKTSKNSLAKFLFTRGLWLVFIELTVVNFSWTFDISLGVHIFQVIWAIGICMMLLAALIYIPGRLLLVLGALIVIGHNALDGFVSQGNEPLSMLWYFTHQHNFQVINDGQGMLAIAYPFLPWLGIMILGYCFGYYYQKGFDTQIRKKWLLRFGIGAIVLFFILRFANVYGDLKPWETKDSATYTVLSFINVTKYPPSLIYVLMTLGPALLFLNVIESVKNRITSVLVTIGRVPFFYYIIHLYVIHLIGMFGLEFMGENWQELILTVDRFKSGYLFNIGFDLWVTYLVWILVVVLLYPLCKAYMKYKANNRDKWWLSYL